LTGNFEVALNSVATIQSAFSDIQNRSQSFTEVSAELGSILQKLDLQLQDLNHHLKSLDQVADSAKQAFPIIEDNLTKLTAGFKKSTEQSLADITSTVETVGENLVESMVQHKDMLQKTIMDTGTILKNTTVTVANNLTVTTNTMKSIMETQQETLSSTSTEFKTVVNQTMTDFSQHTQASAKNLQQAVTMQLDCIEKNNILINKTIQNASVEFEKSIKVQSELMGGIIVTVSDTFKKSTDELLANMGNTVDSMVIVANDLINMGNSMESIMDGQQQALNSINTEFKQTMNDFSHETQASQAALQKAVSQQLNGIKEYENNLHHIVTNQFTTVSNSITTASKEFNRLLTENTSKSTNVLKEQTELLDKALQAELIKAIGTMGSNLASLSAKFVQDYAPLTEKLRDVVRLADDLKKGR
jgi:hypothetical protein